MCSDCHRSFTSRSGLGVHRQRSHPVEYNEGIVLAGVRRRWTDEIRLLAMDEAGAPPGIVAMNQYLLRLQKGSRSLEAIKGIRKRDDYRQLVMDFKNERLVGVADPQEERRARASPGVVERREGMNAGVMGHQTSMDWLKRKLDDMLSEIAGGIWIRMARC